MAKKTRTGLGQDSHRFLHSDVSKPLILGGILFENHPGFMANSDGDVVLHAICNAISSLTGVLILGGIADKLCLENGISDSTIYVQEALKALGDQKIIHVAISIEAKRPKIKERLLEMRGSVASILDIPLSAVGITATSGEGLTDFGCGDGAQALAIVTTEED